MADRRGYRRSLLVVDGNNLLQRVLRVKNFKELKTSTGHGFGGVFGFLKALNGSLNISSFTSCVVVWDGSYSARRLKLLPTYKGDREAKLLKDVNIQDVQAFRENLKTQKKKLSEVLESLAVKELHLPDREADDVIWWVTRESGYANGAVVLSEDRDFYQLVTEDIDLYRPIQDEYVSADNFESVVKLSIDRFLLYKSILGDKGDNIPGIKGVGKETALEIAKGAPNVGWDAVRDFCARSESKRIRSVADSMETVIRNFDLVTLGLEVLTEEEKQSIKTKLEAKSEFNMKAVNRHLREMEFVSIMQHGFLQWLHPFRRLS